jgi:hypothetical protein
VLPRDNVENTIAPAKAARDSNFWLIERIIFASLKILRRVAPLFGTCSVVAAAVSYCFYYRAQIIVNQQC